MTLIADLRNLGPKSAKQLALIEVHTLDDLKALGPVSCYRMIQSIGEPVSLNLLYAMYGAIHDVPWNRLPPKVKDDLISAVQEPSEPLG